MFGVRNSPLQRASLGVTGASETMKAANDSGSGPRSRYHPPTYIHANLSDDNSDSPSHRYATNGPPLATL
jgi:hypothetical protein